MFELREVVSPVVSARAVGGAPARLRGGRAGRAAAPRAPHHAPRAQRRPHAAARAVAAARAPLAPWRHAAVDQPYTQETRVPYQSYFQVV